MTFFQKTKFFRGDTMNLNSTPFVRYSAKSTYFIKNQVVATLDCRLLYIISGQGIFESNNKKYNLTPGTLLFFPYGTPYKISKKDSQDILFYIINFDFNSENTNINPIAPVIFDVYKMEYAFKSIDKDNNFFNKIIYLPNSIWAENDLKQICKEYVSKSPMYQQLQSAHLKVVLINLYRYAQKQRKKSQIVTEIKNLIKENCTLNNEQIADALHYHPYYICDVFKKSEQITLHQYIIKRRLITAYSLITQTRLSLEEIALQCGFHSQSHLTRTFKKEYNLTPKMLRT